MARAFGSPKTGGRRKGTPNKKTLELEKSLKSNGVDVVSQIAELLPQLEADKKADVLLNLMNYLYPKRKSIELTEDPFVFPEKISIEVVSAKNGKPIPQESLQKKPL